MKKILTGALVALAFVGSVFALDMKVDAGISFPISTFSTTSTITVGDYSKTIKTSSTRNDFGLYVGADYFLTDLIGVGLDLNFGFPIQVTTTTEGKSATTKYGTTENGVKNTAFEFNGLLGCAIRPLNTKKMFLIFTPGLSLDVLSVSASSSSGGISYSGTSTYTYFGLGAGAQFGYKITNKLAISAEMLFAWHFAASGKWNSTYTISYAGYSDSNSNSGTYDSDKIGKPFIFTPKIGISYVF